MSNHKFLFASLSSKPPSSARKVHIRRLYDLFQLCLQRNDLVRAKRAWTILSRCKEIHWMSMWDTAVHLLGGSTQNTSRQLEFLPYMRMQYPEQCEAILRELVLRLIQLGKHEKALDELKLYLHSRPYQDNPVLHIYAGLLSLYLAQPPVTNPSGLFNQPLMRDAQAHFDRAKALDPENAIAEAFSKQIPNLARAPQHREDSDEEEEASEDHSMDIDENEVVQHRKRVRI